MGRARVAATRRSILLRGERLRWVLGRLSGSRAREAELERLLRESERGRREAEERLAGVRRVSSSVAHDVNNLLGVVALVASSLRDQLEPMVREQADELCDSAIRAAKLNRGLLALAKDGAMTDDAASMTSVHGPSVVDVNLVIEGMRRMLERLAGASLDLVVKLDDEPCVVNAEPEQLERVIVNLVTNARDAMAGHGTLRIETERSASTLVPHGDAVVVRVTDTGAGIDHATRPRIFEPFFTTKGDAGAGVGLAAVQDIVAACGGQVQVASEPGGGTRFEVLLPFSSACETRPASAPSSA